MIMKDEVEERAVITEENLTPIANKDQYKHPYDNADESHRL